MKTFLIFLSFIFSMIVKIRNTLFDWKVLPVYKSKAVVVSIGNVTAGGSGKSPLTAYISSQLEKHGVRVAIISRGYGGKYKEAAVAVDPRKENAATYFGDEPVMLAEQVGIPVYVGRARRKAAELCNENYKAECLIADDGFQHRWVYRDVNIVVFDVSETKLEMMPRGVLREPISAVKRADYIFLSRARFVSPEVVQKWKEQFLLYGFSIEKKNLIDLRFDIVAINDFYTKIEMHPNDGFLMSAIGKPEIFETMMKKKMTIKKHFQFPDHHVWTQEEVDALLKECHEKGGGCLVVTEKDAVKLKNRNLHNYPMGIAHMETTVSDETFLKRIITLSEGVRG
jgi:tetraacyldisaccharide 4'-kinase